MHYVCVECACVTVRVEVCTHDFTYIRVQAYLCACMHVCIEREKNARKLMLRKWWDMGITRSTLGITNYLLIYCRGET